MTPLRVVAIDGPAGAGKSSVARTVAERLGWTYVDTGALYRAIGLAALDAGLDPADPRDIAGLVDALPIAFDDGRITLHGVDVEHRIRTPEVAHAAAAIARHAPVRAGLVPLQRSLAAGGEVVMEGRDIGTTIVPEAGLKIFLTASARERARRRAAELGIDPDGDAVAQVESDITARDVSDATRATSPLARANDAVDIDTTDLGLEAVVARIVDLARDRFGT